MHLRNKHSGIQTMAHVTIRGYFLLAVCFSVYTTSQAAVSDVMERCCELGRNWYTTQAERCVPHASPVPGVAQEDQGACSALVQLCCLQYRQERQCLVGRQSAQAGQGCSALHNREASQDARECCNCCLLGLTAHEQGLSCALFQRYGTQCDQSFQECCTDGPRHRDSHQNRQRTTTPPHGGLDICAQFPGQLCQQVCTTTTGSYECSCREGFTLQSDRRTCRQNALGDQCDVFNPCQHKCVDVGITTICECFEGFVLDLDEKSCTDLDECSLGTHTCSYGERCVNTPGGFRCESMGRDRCQQGYTWNRAVGQCEDVDECENTGRCHVSQFCINTQGNYRCVSIDGAEVADADSHFGLPSFTNPPPPAPADDLCGTGFTFSVHTGQCEDINECAMNQDSCTEGQTCENSVGSYHCRRSLSCGTGYTLDQYSQECIDDDECRMGTHNCGVARECKNIPGSFRCVTKVCPHGYRLDYDNGECNPVNCPRGMKPDSAGNCIDINECVERPEVCRPNQECRNHVGSYSCFNTLSCSAGYQLSESGTRCDDIDECRTGKHDCHGSLMDCINIPGSYMCQCPQGYQINHATKTCDDLDECLYNAQTCAQNARCENTHGSYRCLCKEGFQEERDGDNLICKDIDECARPGMCQHECRNTWGAYQCSCSDGYQLAADGRSCDDADECEIAAQKGLILCIGRCENTHGSFTCTCPPGYTLGPDGRTCQDINECALRMANCNEPDDVCINTRGGYKCQAVECPSGFIKAPILGNRNSNVKCQRKTFLCPQGDTQCLHAPLSYSTNFITFPNTIRIPADLFTMRGPLSPYRRLVFDLKVIKAADSVTGQSFIDRSYFNIHQIRDNEAVVQLQRELDGAQDIELQLDMNIYSKEFRSGNDEVFFGTAVARIFIYITKDDW